MENHNITIDNRQRISITEVGDIDSFDETEIRVNLKSGGLMIKGQGLHIQKLDLSDGNAIITGEIDSLAYSQLKEKGQKSLLKKILK
ncbi:MAG: sporulation protein YabP [Anaerovoracaceae bacterium]